MKNHFVFRALMLAGALPFVACALLPLFGFISFGPIGPLDEVAASYGFGILSFVAGTHWAFQLLRPSETPYNLFIASNGVFLVVWIAWVVAPLSWALMLQALAFAFLLHVDRALAARGITTVAYLRLRLVATGAAIVSLLVIAVTP
jgi:hypothetical protein